MHSWDVLNTIMWSDSWNNLHKNKEVAIQALDYVTGWWNDLERSCPNPGSVRVNANGAEFWAAQVNSSCGYFIEGNIGPLSIFTVKRTKVN